MISSSVELIGNGYGEYDLYSGTFKIEETGDLALWKEVLKGEESSAIHTASTLDIVDKRLIKVLERQFQRKETDVKEVELHFQHTLFLAKKVYRHIERSWAWLPLIGWIFANIGKEQARRKFEHTIDLLQFYLHRHGSHVLASKKDLIKELGLEKDYKTIFSTFQMDELLKPFTKEREVSQGAVSSGRSPVQSTKVVAPVPRHIGNLFEHGICFGFFKEPLQSQDEAVELVTKGSGILDTQGNRLLFWKKQEGDDATFHVVFHSHKTQRTVDYLVLVCDRDRDRSFQYEASTNAGISSQPLLINKELPDFPEPRSQKEPFVLSYELEHQSKLQHIIALITQPYSGR